MEAKQDIEEKIDRFFEEEKKMKDEAKMVIDHMHLKNEENVEQRQRKKTIMELPRKYEDQRHFVLNC